MLDVATFCMAVLFCWNKNVVCVFAVPVVGIVRIVKMSSEPWFKTITSIS
jgi:hypothetical protein